MNLPPKILVIDDDQRGGRTIRNYLTTQGYDVCYANNGALGIEKAFEYIPDLVLCAFKMDHLDGAQVLNVLKRNFLVSHVPFIFMSCGSCLEDLRFGMALGADDYFIKPFNNDDLLRSIENRLSKFKALKESGKHNFNTLFRLSPNGIFLFDRLSITDANPSLLQILELNLEEIRGLSIRDIFEKESMSHMEEKLERCFNGIDNNFSELVKLKAKSGLTTEAMISISLFEDVSRISQMIGLVIMQGDKTNNKDNEQTTSEVIRLLKRENITVSISLGKKLAEVFNRQNVNIIKQEFSVFSKRENEVLSLSIEGLPMKLIANRLSISDRTVEKHRAKLMEKTGSSNIVEVIVYALRNNLVAIRLLILAFLPEIDIF